MSLADRDAIPTDLSTSGSTRATEATYAPPVVKATLIGSINLIRRDARNRARFIGKALVARIPQMPGKRRQRRSEPSSSRDQLRSRYLATVRNDPRLRAFYGQVPFDVDQGLVLADFVRSRFGQFRPKDRRGRRRFRRLNALEMLDAAERGERIQCAEICRTLVQLLAAGGASARLVSWLGRGHGSHVVVELWSQKFAKWVVLDVDQNYSYQDAQGRPLSSLELYQGVIANPQFIELIPGRSSHMLYGLTREHLNVEIRHGIVIQESDDALHFDRDVRRARHPFLTAAYVGADRTYRLVYRRCVSFDDRRSVSDLYREPLRQRGPVPEPESAVVGDA